MVNNPRGMAPQETGEPSPAVGPVCLVRYEFYETMWRKMEGAIRCPADIARGPEEDLREWLWDRLYDASPEETNSEVTNTDGFSIGAITDDVPR